MTIAALSGNLRPLPIPPSRLTQPPEAPVTFNLPLSDFDRQVLIRAIDQRLEDYAPLVGDSPEEVARKKQRSRAEVNEGKYPKNFSREEIDAAVENVRQNLRQVTE